MYPTAQQVKVCLLCSAGHALYLLAKPGKALSSRRLLWPARFGAAAPVMLFAVMVQDGPRVAQLLTWLVGQAAAWAVLELPRLQRVYGYVKHSS